MGIHVSHAPGHPVELKATYHRQEGNQGMQVFRFMVNQSSVRNGLNETMNTTPKYQKFIAYIHNSSSRSLSSEHITCVIIT